MKGEYMIRKMKESDIDTLVSLWFKASVQAHAFVDKEFWQSHMLAMKETYLPMCDTYIYEKDRNILGFISHHQGVIPALFVSPQAQSQGVGRKLLDFMKCQCRQLQLAVYTQNQRAHRFYLAQGFRTSGEQICQFTGHQEITMTWCKM